MTARLLYVGDLHPDGTSSHRAEAFRRLGLEVHGLDTNPYAYGGGRWATSARLRLIVTPGTFRLNRNLLATAKATDPHLIWFDKPTYIFPSTVRSLKRQGYLLVCSILDNPYHPLPHVPGWWLLRHALRHYDVNLVPRPSSVTDYTAAGVPDTRIMHLAFDPWVHYPGKGGFLPPPAKPLTFIGCPHDNRAEFLAEVARNGRPVAVHSPLAHRWLRRGDIPGTLTISPAVWGGDYRNAIRQAFACLGLVTHGHREIHGHRSFEITGCGGMLLAERTEGHLDVFEEDREALYFSNVEEVLEKATFLERHPAARTAFAKAGLRRAWTSGYSNDERQAAALAAIDPRLYGDLPARAKAIIARRRIDLGLDF